MEQVGRFNVYLYSDCNIDTDGAKYHLMDLSEWDGDKRLKQNFLYISDGSYVRVNNLIRKESFLEQLISKPRNSKIAIEESISIITR